MSKGTTHRTVRIEDGLWDAARLAALAEGKSVSDVIREALQAYVESQKAQP